jgi:hypothetical protein
MNVTQYKVNKFIKLVNTTGPPATEYPETTVTTGTATTEESKCLSFNKFPAVKNTTYIKH